MPTPGSAEVKAEGALYFYIKMLYDMLWIIM